VRWAAATSNTTRVTGRPADH